MKEEALKEIIQKQEAEIAILQEGLIKAQAKNQKAFEKEKELLNLKSKFITIASHEFRTPLTIISSATELLKYYFDTMDFEIPKSIYKNFDRITDEIRAMNELMTGILNMARIENATTPFYPQETNLKKLCNQIIIDSFNDRADARYVDIEFRGKEKNIKLDKRLMHSILTNLISNAFKYSFENDNPRLEIDYFENHVQIQISDKGIGIPKAEQNKLFQSFFRASNAKEISGTGLGLVVVKQFVEMHNGKILIESEEGEGCKFILEFPYK